MAIPLPTDPAVRAKAFNYASAQLSAEEKQENAEKAADKAKESLDQEDTLLVEEAYRIFLKQDGQTEWASFIERTEPVDIPLLLKDKPWKEYWRASHEGDRYPIPLKSTFWIIWLILGETVFEGWRGKFRRAYGRNMRKLGLVIDLAEDERRSEEATSAGYS